MQSEGKSPKSKCACNGTNMSALSNKLLSEAFYEATSECLWAQTVSVLAINVATRLVLFFYAPGAYTTRHLKFYTHMYS